MKLDGATVTMIRGRNYVSIPIDTNDIYMKNSSAYLLLNIYERKQVGRYGETHTVKQGFSGVSLSVWGKRQSRTNRSSEDSSLWQTTTPSVQRLSLSRQANTEAMTTNVPAWAQTIRIPSRTLSATTTSRSDEFTNT